MAFSQLHPAQNSEQPRPHIHPHHAEEEHQLPQPQAGPVGSFQFPDEPPFKNNFTFHKPAYRRRSVINEYLGDLSTLDLKESQTRERIS